MPYRDTLIRMRADLVRHDRELEACERFAPSGIAGLHLRRARTMNQALNQLITAALRSPYDPANAPSPQDRSL